MALNRFNDTANFIWSIAELLRGPYRPNQYKDIMLPLTVLRRLPGGGQVPIRVDLHRALRDPRDSLLVQAGDILILQETKGQAMVRYLTNVLDLSFVTELFSTTSSVGTAAATLP